MQTIEKRFTVPVLETRRLLLRPPTLDDLGRWAEFMADPVATRYLGGPQSRSMVWRGLMSMVGAWQLTGVAMFSVLDKATGLWLGRVGPWHPEGWPGDEVGWSLHPDAWGRGYALEAAAACMDYAFDVLGWPQVIHTIEPGNRGSERLAQRLGSRELGMTKLPEPHHNLPCMAWGQDRQQWQRERERVAEMLALRPL